MIKIYRKGPLEAEQFDINRLIDFLGKYPIEVLPVSFIENRFTETYVLNMPQGYMSLNNGDWIATGVNGERWLITDEVFKQKYKELPVIPDYVAEYIDMAKHNETGMDNPDIFQAINEAAEYGGAGIATVNWVLNNGNEFARAWLDGYTVEEDK